MSNMLKLVPGKPGDPLFMLPNRKPVTYREFMIFLKTIVSIIGYDPKNFSTHSFRRGGATHAFRSNVPSELIKEHGDWSSDAYLVYLEFSFTQKLKVSKTMSEFLE